MRITLTLFLYFGFNFSAFTQVNCYIFSENSGERKACELLEQSQEYSQGSKESQLLFDKAIALGPKFAWAYYEKSVPFFKRGFLTEGINILNKAIELKPLDYTPYRAYWYWQYNNYKLCIADLENYYAMPKAYIQTSPGGEKDMRIILGLAYAKVGQFNKGIKTIEGCLNSYITKDDFGLSDYHTLGMLYYMNNEYDKAIETFKKQLTINEDLAGTYYYLGLTYIKKENVTEAKIQLKKALDTFDSPKRFFNGNAGFNVYREEVVKALKSL